MNWSELEAKALAFATKAHEGLTRNDGVTPYIEHCIKVATQVKQLYNNEQMTVTAFLHDTIEDTAVSYEDIMAEFGFKIAEAVRRLSNPWGDEVHWVEKMRLTYHHIKEMMRGDLEIKVEDRICNLNEMDGWAPIRKQRYFANTMVIVTTLLEMKQNDLYNRLNIVLMERMRQA